MKEIGIRVAMGATRAGVFRSMVASAVRLSTVGIVIGAGIATGPTRLLSSFLFGVSPTDPVTFLGIAALLAMETLAAGYAAGRKGLSVNPIVARRHE
ncbi:MAG: FtsX-like permease family protein [Bryobacteraceae bacterium]